MTAKKVKEVKSQEKLTLDSIEIGMKLFDSTKNPKEHKIDDDLIEQMRHYEQESNKSAIYRGKITGTFLYFKYYKDNPQEKKEKKKPGRKPKEDEIDEEEEIEEAIEEVADEENLILDCIEDYKAEYNVKKINTNTKKFKAFFEEWKQAE